MGQVYSVLEYCAANRHASHASLPRVPIFECDLSEGYKVDLASALDAWYSVSVHVTDDSGAARQTACPWV